MIPIADKDTITKEYMQDSEIFADAFNYLIYDGEQVIKPEQLRPLDTTSIALPYGDDGKPVPIQRYRDVLKMVTAMEDGNLAYLLLGVENQSQIHHAMPVRNMLYDALQYSAQVDEAAKSHKMSDKAPETRAEFLSGFYKTDKLLPVITLTIYFGAEKWDAPKSLYEMFPVRDDKVLRFISDYRLNLIAPAEIADEDFAKFHTELSLAMKFVKYSNNKERLIEKVEEDAAFKDVSKETADMLNIVTNSELHYVVRKGRVDMCEAIKGIRNDGVEIGRELGFAEGREKERSEIAEKMRRSGMTEEQIKKILNTDLTKI